MNVKTVERPLAAVEAALEKFGLVEDQLRLYEARSREVPSTQEAGWLLARAGELARDRLKNAVRAEELFRRALVYSPTSKEALEGLRALYEQRQDHGALVDVLERLAGTQTGPAAAALYLRAADLHETKLGRKDRAVLCCQLATKAAPQERAAFQRARAILWSESRYNAVFDSLERERAALGERELLDDYLKFAEALADDPYQHGLAEQALQRVLRVDPTNAKAQAIRTAMQRLAEEWPTKVKQLRHQSLEERDRRAAARISLHVAKLYSFFDPSAVAKMKEALDRCFLLWPAMPDAVEVLEQVAVKSGDYKAAIAVFSRLAAATKDKSAQVDLLLRVGTVQLARLNDTAAALEAFTKAAAIDLSRGDAAGLAAELLIEKGELAEGVAVLEKHLGTLKLRSAQVVMHLRLADLWVAQGKNAKAARRHLEAAVRLEPANAHAAFRLVRALADAGELESLWFYLELAASAPRPAEERVKFCIDVSGQFEKAKDYERAFYALSYALPLEPNRPGLLEKLIAMGHQAQLEPALAVTLRRAAQVDDGPDAVKLWRELARLLSAAGAAKQVEAMEAWLEVERRLAHDKEATTAIAALKKSITADPTDDPRTRLEAEARKLEVAAADPAAQAAVYQQILAIDPNSVVTLKKLGAACASLSQWGEVASVAERLMALAESTVDRQEWRARLAQLYAERLGRKEEAAGLYLNLLNEGVESAAVVGNLERLASQGIRQTEISRALAPFYAKGGDYQRQVASLLVQLASVHEVDAQKELLGLLAETSEKRLMDPEGAFNFRLRGLALAPEDSTFRAEAIRLAREHSAHGQMARVLFELASKTDDAALATSLWQDAAVVAEQGGAIDDAAAALKAALSKTPGHVEMLAQLSELYLRHKRYSEGEQVLRTRVAAVPDAEKSALYLQLADIDTELGRPREAAGALMDAVKYGADELTHLPRIVELLETSGRPAEVSDALLRWSTMLEKAGDGAKASALFLRRAKLLETSLGDKAEAIRRYADVLKKNPSDPEAVAALEGLLGDEDHRYDAAVALVPAYETIRDHRKQVQALSVIAYCARDSLEQINAYRRTASIHTEQLRQPEQAFAAMANAMRLLPDDAQIRAETRAAAERADMFDTYADELVELLPSLPVGSVAAVHRELADVYEKRLNQHGPAVEQLQALLKIEPKNVDALKALHRLHRTREEWNELLPIVERLASVETDAAAKTALDQEAALLAEQKLNDPARAAANWRLIAARDALDREAAAALDRLYTQLDQPQELAFALELRRNQEGATPQGREYAFRLAVLRQQKLGDGPGALQLYRQILADDPAHVGSRDALEAWAKTGSADSGAAIEVLDPVLAQTGEHDRRIALREARLSVASVAERSRLSAEIRAIFERDLAQPERAFMSALKAFTDGLDRDVVKPELERLAQLTGSFEDLAEIYETTAEELEGEHEEKVPLLRSAAQLMQQAGKNDEAIRVWQALLVKVPQDRQALDALSQLFEKSKNAQSLSEVYSRKAELTQDPNERFELLMQAGDNYEAAGEEERAIAAFKEAVELKNEPEAWIALEHLYAKSKRSADQALALYSLAHLASDSEQRRGYLLRRSQLLEKDQQAGEALSGYAAILEITPMDPQAIAGLERLFADETTKAEAARLLEPCYRDLKELRKLVDVLDVRLTELSGAPRAAMLHEMATLRESLGQKPMALALRLRAFAENPEDAGNRDELERLAADTGNFEELAAAYEDCLERKPSPELTEALWRRLAQIYAERLSRPDLAAKAWSAVLAKKPQEVGALDALSRLYRKMNAHRELAQVMAAQIKLQTDVGAQVNLLYELASLSEEMLADKPLAARCYQAILDRKSDDTNAIRLLGRVLAETERYPELAQLIVREIALAEAAGAQEQALELMVRLGRIKLTRLSDPRGALAQFQEVLRRKPAHAGAVGALEEMARSDNALKGEAATMLEPVFAKEGEHLKLVQMLEARVAAETSLQERVALRLKIADVYASQMDNAEMAFVAAAQALRDVPESSTALEATLRLYPAADVKDEMLALLEEVAPRVADGAARANMYRTLARLQTESQLAEEALESWKHVLETAPSDPEALEAFSRLLGKQNKVPELLEVLRKQLAMAEEPARRASLMYQIGVLQADQGKDAAGALATFRRLLELKPDDPQALERMDALCAEQERWPELADVLARRIALATGEAQLELKYRLAMVREAKLLDKAGAVELLTELLTADPKRPGPLARMEALVTREPNNAQAVEVLLKAYRASGDLTKLSQLIEARVGVSPDAFERKQLLLDLATMRDAQDEPELTYLALWRAFKEDPNDAELRKKLEAAATAAKTFDELAAAYEEQLPRIAEASDAAEVCLKVGQLLEQHLDEAERAAEFFEKARSLSVNAGPRALAALDRLYTQLDRPKQLVEVLEALAALAKEPAEQVGLLFRVGQLAHERLENVDQAATALERVLKIDPKHLPSARLLEKLYEQTQTPDKLYRVLELQRELVTGPERERILGRMASVSSDNLSDVDHSIELYRELLAKNPRSEQAYTALEALLEKAKRFDELRDMLQSRLTVTVDPRELVRLNERLGKLMQKHLGKPEEAIPFFKAALERDARNKAALEALREIFETTQKREDLVIVLRRLIPLQEDAEGVKALRIRLAEVLSEAGRREEALDAARRSLEVEPHSAADLEKVHAIFMHLKAWPDAVRSLELKSEALLALEDREGAIKALFGVADLWKSQANKPDAAGGAFEKILEIDPANRAAYEHALKHYSTVNDWRGYAQAMDRYLPNLVTEEEKINSLRELAKVQEGKLGQKDVAFLKMCQVVQLTPADDAAREEVERLATETGSYEELAAVYEEVADNLPRGPLAERLYLVLAKVHEQRLDDIDAAESALRRILEFDPTNEQALDAMAAMFNRRGRDKEYIIALEQKLEAAGSIEKRKEILREVSRVYLEKLENPFEASQALSRALELEPDVQTLTTLVALQRREKDFAAVASSLLRMRDLAAMPEERAKLQVDVALVYERDLLDDEAAIEGYRQALEFDPTNAAALEALERLYTKLDRPGELLAVYERQLELATDYRERVKVLFRSAAIWEDRYQNLPNADACVESVLALDPQNLQAIKTLERLRKAQGRYDELIGVVDRHIALLSNPAEKAELCVEMGDVFHHQLEQVDRAVAAYDQALQLNPKCRPAMHALGTLYERSGNWPFALDMMEREAQVLGATPEAVELYHRMGKINEDMLLDAPSAKRCYQEALKIDPAYLPCIRALKGIFEIEKDFGAYESMLIQEAKETNDPGDKSRAMLEVARYFAEKKEDRAQASAYYEEALALVPDSLDAARPLADIYIAAENWKAGERMLDIVTAKMSERLAMGQEAEGARELCRQYYRLGYVSEKTTHKDKALKAYEKAYQLDATYLPALEGLGNLLVQAKRFEEAQKVYQTILLHHKDDLTDLEVVEIYWTLGDIALQQKQLDRAQNHFEKALSIDPGHEPSLRSQVVLTEQQGQWDKAAQYRLSLLGVTEGDAKYDLAMELGKVAREKLRDAHMAIDAYQAAHKLRPQALEVLDSLYVLYRETKQPQKATEVLELMLAEPELQKDAQRGKRVWYALGELCRDELKELDRAAHAFNAALDLDYRFLEAFSALEQMQGRNKLWKPLEQNYVRMIQRLPKGEETHAARMAMWKALGDLYLKVLKQPEAAVQAYQVVATASPDDAAIQESYAELASQQPGLEEKAIEAWRRALPATANPGKIAKALMELAAKKKDYDSAWLAAQVSAGLIGNAGDGEREILTKLTPYAKKKEQAQRPLTDRLWHQHLFHPKMRGPMAEMMGLLFEQAGHLYKQELAQYHVNPKKHLIDVTTAQEYQIHHFRYVSRLLGMEQVAVFSPFLVTTREKMAKRTSDPAPEPMVGIEICHTHPVCLKVGGKFFSETGTKEVYYMLGRTLALLRPELALSARLSAERLEAVFQAAISLSVNTFRWTADKAAIEAERRALEKTLTESARNALARVTKEYVARAGSNDLRNYLEGAELSAVRTGLFVAGEIEPVKKMVMGEQGSAQRVPARSKLNDLLIFALGDDLHALRVAVGTHVEVQLKK